MIGGLVEKLVGKKKVEVVVDKKVEEPIVVVEKSSDLYYLSDVDGDFHQKYIQSTSRVPSLMAEAL